MTNREWLLKEMQNMSDEEFVGVIRPTCMISKKLGCDKMKEEMGVEALNCEDCVQYWLKAEHAEHKEKPKLSEAERVILENIPKDHKWIARDSDKELRVFRTKPSKEDTNLWIEKTSSFARLSAFNHLFQFIQWSDDEPYEISELLKGE